MNKHLLLPLAAAVLLAVVFCTAGCVTEDQITGKWLYLTDDSASLLRFEADETGVFAGLVKSETGDLVYEDAPKTSFAWKKTGASEYQLTFPDEAVETVAADMVRGTLVFKGETYEKQASELSGFPILIGIP